MTKEAVKRKVRDILTSYLIQSNRRKTSERYAILDAVYGADGHFSLDELSAMLEKQNFRVSRATLYNTMRLFIELRLVVRHRFIGQTKYEACYLGGNHLHQVCTVCGGVTEVNSPEIIAAVSSTKLHRFHADGFTLYIYGVCSSCQTKLSRQRKKNKQNKIQNEYR